MHSRIVIVLSLMALTAAAPQYGYGYEAQQQQQQKGPISAINHSGNKYLPPASTTATPLVHKQFYSISAPEDTEGQQINKHLVLGRPQRNYRVVFIKAPGANNANVKYSAEYAPQEEKTVIYVLSKKENILESTDIATPAPAPPSKPEVFFIKYKTPQEAEAAQNEIQNEYAKLEGTNEFSDEGVAPVTSVVGSLDSITSNGSYNYQVVDSAPKSQEKSSFNQYLPSITK